MLWPRLRAAAPLRTLSGPSLVARPRAEGPGPPAPACDALTKIMLPGRAGGGGHGAVDGAPRLGPELLAACEFSHPIPSLIRPGQLYVHLFTVIICKLMFSIICPAMKSLIIVYEFPLIFVSVKICFTKAVLGGDQMPALPLNMPVFSKNIIFIAGLCVCCAECAVLMKSELAESSGNFTDQDSASFTVLQFSKGFLLFTGFLKF